MIGLLSSKLINIMYIFTFIYFKSNFYTEYYYPSNSKSNLSNYIYVSLKNSKEKIDITFL
jgi:hypothetical protein